MPGYKFLVTVALKNPKAAFFAFIQRLRRLFPLDYYFLNGLSFYPEIVQIIITRRCNFRCDICFVTLREEIKSLAEITTDEIKQAIDKVSYFKPVIYICGGEPSIRLDLLEIIRYIKSKELVCAMTTNGTLFLTNSASEIIDSGIDFLSVSIDGTEEFHDSKRKKDGAYRTAVEGLKKLVETKRAEKLLLPHIKIACIIDPNKPENAEHVLELANKIGVDEVAYGHLMFHPGELEKEQIEIYNKTGLGGPYMTGMTIENLDNAEVEKIENFVKTADKRSKLRVSFVPHDIDIASFYSFNHPSTKSACLTPWISATILPNGDISPCLEFKIGNIKEKKFSDIWNDKKWREFRKYRKCQQFPACFRCGEGQILKFDRGQR